MSDRSAHEPRRRARRRALQALYQWRLNPADSGTLLAQFRQAQDFSNVDIEWFTSLVTGVMASAEELEGELAGFVDRDISKLDVIERIILLMGAWELRNHPELPHQVILDEAVELARRFGAEQGHGYVNAVLDRAARQWRTAVEDVPRSPSHGQ